MSAPSAVIQSSDRRRAWRSCRTRVRGGCGGRCRPSAGAASLRGWPLRRLREELPPPAVRCADPDVRDLCAGLVERDVLHHVGAVGMPVNARAAVGHRAADVQPHRGRGSGCWRRRRHLRTGRSRRRRCGGPPSGSARTCRRPPAGRAPAPESAAGSRRRRPARTGASRSTSLSETDPGPVRRGTTPSALRMGATLRVPRTPATSPSGRPGRKTPAIRGSACRR